MEVRPGEVMGLVGDNGAGKSTLIKAIAGVQPADVGQTTFAGRARDARLAPGRDRRSGSRPSTRTSRSARTSTSSPTCSSARRSSTAGPFVLDETSMEQKTEELLASLGVTTIRSVRTEVERLSGGQRQAIAIARSLLGEPKLVLLDEPTAALGVVQTKAILDLIQRLRDRGLGVIVISHNLADVFQVADRVTVLRLGRVAGELRDRRLVPGGDRRRDHRRRVRRRR